MSVERHIWSHTRSIESTGAPSTKRLYQTAEYQVKAEAVDTVKRAIEEFVEYVRANEPGTRLYRAWQRQDDPTRFVTTVKQGKNGKMPPWGDILSEEQIADIWAFVSSRRKP